MLAGVPYWGGPILDAKRGFDVYRVEADASRGLILGVDPCLMKEGGLLQG